MITHTYNVMSIFRYLYILKHIHIHVRVQLNSTHTPYRTQDSTLRSAPPRKTLRSQLPVWTTSWTAAAADGGEEEEEGAVPLPWGEGGDPRKPLLLLLLLLQRISPSLTALGQELC